MSNSQPVDFAQKASQLDVSAEQFDTKYSDDRRAIWLTAHRLADALQNAAKAAKNLACLKGKVTGLPMETLFAQVAGEIDAVEQMVAAFDAKQVTTDAIYAGRRLQEAECANNTGEAAQALSAALKKLVETGEQCNQAKAARERLADPQRPKRKYAVVKQDFIDRDGGGPVPFYRGVHCVVDAEFDNGMRVDGGAYSVFMNNDKLARYFDIVEL